MFVFPFQTISVLFIDIKNNKLSSLPSSRPSHSPLPTAHPVPLLFQFQRKPEINHLARSGGCEPLILFVGLVIVDSLLLLMMITSFEMMI
jgi:hypothetical protein